VSDRRYVEDVEVGGELGPDLKDTSRARLVAYAGATLDDYLIHLDREFARGFGLPDVIVQGPLKSAYLGQLARDWVGEGGALRELEVQYRGIDVALAPLTARGVVTRKLVERDEQLVECEIWLESSDGQRNTHGRALIALPSRAVPGPVRP
jgi:acyl dehydratase